MQSSRAKHAKHSLRASAGLISKRYSYEPFQYAYHIRMMKPTDIRVLCQLGYEGSRLG